MKKRGQKADTVAAAAAQPVWEAVEISEGLVKKVVQFKYLGGVLVVDGKLEVELAIWGGRAYGRFKQFE
jgi:regulator of RNase E activity RraA